MRPPHDFERRLAQSWPPAGWQEVGVLVAVSGGADSVALLRGLAALKTDGPGRLVAAHFDHRLRGMDSTADREFVVALCQQLGIECHVGQWDAGRSSAGRSSSGYPDGVEAAARAARYEFLQATAERLGARYVAAAHTFDDQAETVLHHLVRGTGLAGLAGMSRARPLGAAVTLIRPLLAFRRSDVLEYLGALGQPYCDDATNRDPAFTRSRIRHELLPLLARDYNPRVIDALVRLSSLASETQATIDGLVAELAARCVVRREPGQVEIDLEPLATAPRHLVRECMIAVWREQGWPLQSMGFEEWELLAGMAAANPGESRRTKRVFPGGVVVERSRKSLTLRRAAGP
jgi:tRNA(Ile)-lysidine synthase